jgi:uncharacterized protein YneF (UPF0154 family)
MTTLAKMLIVMAIMLSFSAGVAIGGFVTWYDFMKPEIERLTKENAGISKELEKARKDSAALAKNQARRESEAENARQANAEALRGCVYPDDLRMHLEALAKRTRDGGRYEEREDKLRR